MSLESQNLPFWGVILSLVTLLSACGQGNNSLGSTSLNSRYNEEQPVLSGDGNLVAFVTNRNGISQILVYDLSKKLFLDLPGLNSPGFLPESPSLSRTGRYIVYLVNNGGQVNLVLYDQAIKQSQILINRYSSWLRRPRVSPDGRYIVFETAKRGQWDLEVFDRGPNIELDLQDGTTLP